VVQLAATQGLVAACAKLGVLRSSVYRLRQATTGAPTVAGPRPPPPRALSAEEREAVHLLLNSEPYQDQAPREVYAALLDSGVYLCSWRTMYRVLAEAGEVQERRNQLRHPAYGRPELLATGPNQLFGSTHPSKWGRPFQQLPAVTPMMVYWPHRSRRIITYQGGINLHPNATLNSRRNLSQSS